MASAQARPIRVLALTPAGAGLARRLCRELPGAACWLPEGLAAAGEPSFQKVSQAVAAAFGEATDLVCIMASGIVVRSIAPLLADKATDPAVVVMDEAGKFAISLVSGHLGGANALARRVAGILAATPVITTATDVHGLPGLDTLAAATGLIIENLEAVRPVHLALLKSHPVRVLDPYGYLTAPLAPYPELFIQATDLEAALTATGPAVYVGHQVRPFPPDWLILRPRDLVAGLGCHRGIAVQEILDLIANAFATAGLSLRSLRALATIAARKDEPGLIEAAQELRVEFLWFTKAELQEITVPHPSPQAARHLGVASVSEAAALKAAGPELILPKVKSPNATLAVARGTWRS